MLKCSLCGNYSVCLQCSDGRIWNLLNGSHTCVVLLCYVGHCVYVKHYLYLTKYLIFLIYDLISPNDTKRLIISINCILIFLS